MASAALVVPHLELDPVVEHVVAPAGGSLAAEITACMAVAAPIEDTAMKLSPPPDEWLDEAAVALEQGNFKTAERLGRCALADHDPFAQEFLDVMRLIRRGAKLAQRWPRDPQVHLDLAKAYFCVEAGAAAVHEAAEALRLDPSLGECHAVLGFELLYRGDLDGARTAWNQARALAPEGHWQAGLATALLDASVPPSKLRRGAEYVRRRMRDVVSHVGTAIRHD
jgi:tetratricopeptide (TPR) repeat protein